MSVKRTLLRQNLFNTYGGIGLTLSRASPDPQPVDQTSQRRQVSHPERAPASRRHDEHIRLDRIRPAHRQRVLHPLSSRKNTRSSDQVCRTPSSRNSRPCHG